MVRSLWVTVSGPPQLSVAVTAPSLGAGTALAHWTVTLVGMLVMIGGTVSLTSTPVEQELTQLLLVTVSCSVKFVPQSIPAATVTV